jgi:large subunit ribosomal protein L10
MPSKKNIEQYEDLSEKFSRAKAVYFTEYHGLKVGQITSLRNMFFQSDVEYLVAKNTLLRKVAEDRKIKGLGDVLKGSTAIAISYNEPVSPAKVIKNFTKENDLPSVKGILFDGVVLPGEDFKKLADMPSKNEMLAQLVLMLKSPIQKFVSTISSPMQNALGVLNSLKEKKS